MVPPHPTKAKCYLKFNKPKAQENSASSRVSDEDLTFGERAGHGRINYLILQCVWVFEVFTGTSVTIVFTL